jgi:hypothetical protein
LYKEKEMLSFRKALWVLAALTLTSGMAMAQALFEPPLSCTAQAAGTPSIRDNGVAELVGDVLILCTGGRPRPANEVLPQINVQIFTQPVINITSRWVYGADSWGQFNEALLFVDEPAVGSQVLCGSTNAGDSAQPGSGQAQVVGVCGAHVGQGVGFAGPGGGIYGTGIGSYSGSGPNVFFCAATSTSPGVGFPIGSSAAIGSCPAGTSSQQYATRRPNAFQGRQAGNNSVIFQGIPIDPPGTTTTRVIRITNVRVNASQLNNPRGLQSTVNLIISTSASGVTNPISMPITNPAPTVALAQTPLDYSITDGPDTFLQCQSQNNTSDDPFYTNTSEPLTQGSQFALRFQERFPTAFRRRSAALPVDLNTPGDPTTLDQSQLGIPYQTETGHYNPTTSSNWNTANSLRGGNLSDPRNGAGVASHGTRLLARFSNLPNGARLWVAASLNAFQIGTTGTSTGTARATVSDSNGGGTFGAIEPGTTSTVSQYSGRMSQQGLVEVVPVGGNGFMTWEILNANTTVFERVEIPAVVTYAANTSNNLPTLGTAKSDGQLAPLSTRSTAGTGSSAPIPRFVEDPNNNGKNIFTINACVTNLLFPFVSNQAGFDTGLAISNTSKDPFGTALQTGACTVNFYGRVGTSKVCLSHPSPSITGGEHFAWSLANGGAVTATAGFQGYVIAQCAFQYAHGYAFISDLGAQKLAQGYLALILDDDISGESRTKSVSEVLGH